MNSSNKNHLSFLFLRHTPFFPPPSPVLRRSRCISTLLSSLLVRALRKGGIAGRNREYAGRDAAEREREKKGKYRERKREKNIESEKKEKGNGFAERRFGGRIETLSRHERKERELISSMKVEASSKDTWSSGYELPAPICRASWALRSAENYIAFSSFDTPRNIFRRVAVINP